MQQQLVKDIADAMIQEPKGLRIAIKEDNLNFIQKRFDKLFKKPERTHVFVLKPLVLGTLIRISKTLADIEEVNRDDFKSGLALTKAFNIYMSGKGEQIIDIIALALTNTEKYPSQSLINLIKWNVSNEELYQLIEIIVSQINVSPFMNSIIFIKGMSLISPGGIIASGESAEDFKNISE